MYNQSMLVSIQQSVNEINWQTPKQKDKANKLCACIYNLYVLNGYNFSQPVSLSSKYFETILPSKRDYIIKAGLVDAGILNCDNKYNVDKGIAKGYKFGNEYFAIPEITSTDKTFTILNQSNKSTGSYLFPHFTEPINYLNQSNKSTGSSLFPHLPKQHDLQGYCLKNLSKLNFDSDTDLFINEISTISNKDLILNDYIEDDFVDIRHGKDEYRYGKEKAIAKAAMDGNDLIKYKNGFYFDKPENFIENKSKQLNLIYCQSVFNIKNNLFYCGRNDTNNRLDYNLTAIKKELFGKLKLDGENLIELDIANAQFAIAAYLNPTTDENFILNAKGGTLYAYVENELGLSEGTGKQLMFRIAFDKVIDNQQYNQIRNLFPKFMDWVDTYKNMNGYKMFSNMLQKKEAEIMIDGLLTNLIEKGYDVFTIHDALRIRQSQADEIGNMVKDYFDRIGFICTIRRKG